MVNTNHGSILIEGSVLLVVVFFGVVLQIELCRRIWTGMVLQYSAFHSVRNSVLVREESQKQSNENNWILKTLPFVLKKETSNLVKDRIGIERRNRKLISIKQVRYPSLLMFEEGGFKKKYFEVTQRCSFPFF